jgi:hypothetical protein
MVLWTRIWYGKLKRVFVTSFLVGISLMLLLIMVGVPMFSRSVSTARHSMRSVDAANKRKDTLSIQPHLGGLSSLPSIPTTLVTPTAPVMSSLSTASSDQPKQIKPVSEAPMPAVVIIIPRHIPVIIQFRVSVKQQTGPTIKPAIKPTSTAVSSHAPVRVITTAVATPTPTLSPVPTRTVTPTPIGHNTPTPDASPAPVITGTARDNPTPLPETTTTPTSTHLSGADF